MRANVTTFSKITAVAVGALVRSAKAVPILRLPRQRISDCTQLNCKREKIKNVSALGTRLKAFC